MTISATNISLTAIRNEFVWNGSNRYNGAAAVAYVNTPYKISDFAAGGEVVPKNDGSLSGITRYNALSNFAFGEFANIAKPVLYLQSYDEQGGYEISNEQNQTGNNRGLAGIRYHRDGYAEVVNDDGNGGDTNTGIGDWITDGYEDYDNEEYEIKLEQTGNNGAGIQGSTNNSWLKLNDSPYWYVEETYISNNISASGSTGNIQIRRAPADGSTPYIVDQVDYYLYAEVDGT